MEISPAKGTEKPPKDILKLFPGIHLWPLMVGPSLSIAKLPVVDMLKDWFLLKSYNRSLYVGAICALAKAALNPKDQPIIIPHHIRWL
jgi:hypothetical protein